MKKKLLILILLTLNLSAYYGPVQFKNEYGFIMSYGWLQQVQDDRYDIYVASDENMEVGSKKIYVKFNNITPKKVKISVISQNNEIISFKTKKIDKKEWFSIINIPISCHNISREIFNKSDRKCKIRVELDGENLKDIELYL